MSKVKYFLAQSWLLIVASVLFGLLLAGAEAALNPRIVANEQEKLNSNMQELISQASQFEMIVEGMEVPTGTKSVKTNVYRAVDAQGHTVGYAFIAVGPGFADKIKLVIAVDARFDKYLGFKVLFSNETPGFGDRIKTPYYADQYVGAPVERLELSKIGNPGVIDNRIVAISGATVSSEAVINIFNTFGRAVKAQLQAKGIIDHG